MISCICTLFEGNYQFGLAALVNSLASHGYRGKIFAGYRGVLPDWASQAEGDSNIFPVTECIAIYFIELTTNSHLTNFKPDFMLKIGINECPEAEAVFYFDPDITIAAPWSYFEKWVYGGMALCEDVNSPLSLNHPRRLGWRNHFASLGRILTPRETIYVNGGCIGLKRAEFSFLESWRDLQNEIAPLIGSLEASKLGGGTSTLMRDPLFPFNASDQDTLNAALEAMPDCPASILGAEAMGFRPGNAILPHSVGTPKPWEKRYIRSALCGRPPTVADKMFWQFAQGPIHSFSPRTIWIRRKQLQAAAAIGRFIRRA